MVLDSYVSPRAQSLLRSGQERHAERDPAKRVLVTEGVAAALFLLTAGLVAALATPSLALSLEALVVTVFAYLVASQVRFQVGSAWTAPTQLVFVPMLFMLPMPVVPLVVAGCLVLDLWPEALAGRLRVTQILARVGDSFYSLGPVLVLVLAGHQIFSWDDAPLLVLAFAAQVVLDASTGLLRTWFAERIRPAEQVQMLWLYVTDACLSCVGLAIAAVAVERPALVLLTLPGIGLLAMFAHERKQRLDGTLALSSAYRGAAHLMGDVIDAVDHYTGVHTREVVELSLAVTKILDLDTTHQRDVEFAALLHDVGKIRIPSAIINKPGKLDEAEWAIIRQHTIEGEAMLAQVGGTLAGVGRLVRASHERYDGGGYPDGLTGEEIPIESRIVCVCDAYNAMTTNRPYRTARRVSEALEELRSCAGTQFDPLVVNAVERLLASRVDSEPAGPRPGDSAPAPADSAAALTS
jgi:HD-GYP domain-containing protein (c-di-GMP phosphodiesterase class II)